MTHNSIDISDFDYPLPDERIAKFPAAERDSSKLLVWRLECHRRRPVVQNDSCGGGDGNRRDCTIGTGRRSDEVSEAPRTERREGEISGTTRMSQPPGAISRTTFADIGAHIPAGSLLVFNNTRVVRARLIMHKHPAARMTSGDSAERATGGARIELLCLEPHAPADYERAFAAKGSCRWLCMVGNLKRWKPSDEIVCGAEGTELRARRTDSTGGAEQIVEFRWEADLTFGQLLERLGRMPIPPYLGRDEEPVDGTRYQTVYSLVEGSVAAPTAGLHFTPELIERLKAGGGKDSDALPPVAFDQVTLHVGAGTFLPVKVENALDHPMHTEHFEVKLATIEHLTAKIGGTIAVGTTSVRTLESLAALAWRIVLTGGAEKGSPETERPVGQFESRDIPAGFDGKTALETLADHMRAHRIDTIKASTRIMITPGFRFRIVSGLVTNFHQPKSTLLLLIAAFTGGDEWRRIYDHALSHDFRFLSYGDSSLLLGGL